jgi:hypothetical protein
MLAFGAMAVPLAQLTFAKPKPATAAAAPKVESKLISSLIRIRYAHKPKSVSLKLGGREMLASSALDSSPVETRTAFEIPADGIEFVLSAEWPEGTASTALTLEIEPDGLDMKTETRWSTGTSLTEVIPFQWK